MESLTSHHFGEQGSGFCLVYRDEGVCEPSAESIKNILEMFLPSLQVRFANSKDVCNLDWERKTKLIVFAGGEAAHWEKNLGSEGMSKVAAYIRNGGRGLGICAGAYFLSKKSIFFKENRTLKKKRPSGVFKGAAKGPRYEIPTGEYLSYTSARAASIALKSIGSLSHTKGDIYYLGGCTFYSEDEENTEVLAEYLDTLDETKSEAAIILYCAEKGKVVLSGVHPELDLNGLETCLIPEVAEIACKVQKSAIFRFNLLEKILMVMDLPCQNTV